MRKLLLTAISSAVLLLIPSFSQAQETNAQLSGTVAYRERMALPSDATIDVQLIDTSLADVAAQAVAEVLINAEGRQAPVPFTLSYDPAKIVPGNRYSVRATIRSGDGMLMFSTTQAYPVLTHGAPSKVNLIVHTVGHGAHPAALAKERAAPAASESTASASQSALAGTPESAPPATPASSEAAPGAMTSSPAESAKPSAQAAARSAETEPAAAPSSSTAQESGSAPASPRMESSAAAPPSESTPPETAPPAESASRAPVPESAPASTETAPPPTSATMEHQTATAESPAAATPEAPTAQTESRPAEAQTPEQTAPPEGKTEPTTPAPEAKGSEPEAALPEAPSATKRAELEAAAPESAEPEPESSSRAERPAPNKALTPLADTQWKLIQLAGAAVVITPPQKPVTLAFSPEGRRIAGSAGCNSYLGTFSDDHGRLHLNPGNMTMMACADPAGSRERKFIAMLRAADGYKVSGDFLLLTSNGKTVAKFKNNQVY